MISTEVTETLLHMHINDVLYTCTHVEHFTLMYMYIYCMCIFIRNVHTCTCICILSLQLIQKPPSHLLLNTVALSTDLIVST